MNERVTSAELALLLDVGSAWTKASLVGRVGGRWRIVAHTAGPTSWGPDAMRRSLAAILSPSSDRRLTTDLEALIENANRIECHTAPRPGRLALAAVSRELSGATARRVAESAGWIVAEIATVDDGRPLAERLAALQAVEVDAWLVAGGFDAAASPRALEAAAIVAAARRPGSGPVIWAGSARLAPDVAALFEADAVTAVPNARPDARTESPGALRVALEELLRRSVEPEGQVHLATTAFRRGVAELARSSGLRVLGVDLGARYATWVTADPDGAVESRVFAAGGLAGAALGTQATARIARGIGQAVDERAVADIIQNLAARPETLPQTDDELAVTQAVARAQLAAAADGIPPATVDLVVGAGRAIAAAPNPAHALQALLDGVRPVGVVQLAIDAAGVLGPLGSLDAPEIHEGVALIAEDLLDPLGTAVVCRGGAPGRRAMRVTLRRTGWPDRPPLDVRSGQLQVVPLPRGSVAEMTIELGDGVSLGTPRRAERVATSAAGGAIGLVLDGRGIPMALPRRTDDRRAVLDGWSDMLVREPHPSLEAWM